jgi:hypothetical protein
MSNQTVLSKPAGHYDPLALAARLYEALLANPTVQTGLTQVSKYSQPILTRVNEDLSEPTLNFLEARLDQLLALLNVKQEQSNQEGTTLAEKRQRILTKLQVLTSALYKKVEEVVHRVQATKTYGTLDSYLHINERIDDTVHLTAFGYKLIKENILEPAFGQVKVIRDQTKSQITIVINGLDVQALKKRYSQLHAKYEVLQKCLVIVADETVKLVFDKKALSELGENGRQELNRLYSDLKSLETDKIKQTGVEYYAKILKKAQTTYNTARQSVYVKNLELGNEDAANAVKPEGYAVAAH